MKKEDFIFSLAELEKYLSPKWNLKKVKLPENPKSQDMLQKFFLLIPKYYIDLIDWYDESDPLRQMVLTSPKENLIKKYELEDPIGDKTHSPVPGIIHRYPDRVLLNLTNICAVHCRFCFRRNLLAKNTADLEKSLQYIKKHKEIWEVIFSGGDPFMLNDEFLSHVLKKLREISHVKIIRFHTRTPAVYPDRITKEFIKILEIAKPSVIVFHINHPGEVTAEFRECVEKLKKTGAMLLSQTVLMRGVNNNAETLKKLFRNVVETGIKPYYLHHLDFAAGTDHFRVSLEDGKNIMQALRGNISGECIPEYVIEIPGGMGKIPIFWLQKMKKTYKGKNFQGQKIAYRDPAQSHHNLARNPIAF